MNWTIQQSFYWRWDVVEQGWVMNPVPMSWLGLESPIAVPKMLSNVSAMTPNLSCSRLDRVVDEGSDLAGKSGPDVLHNSLHSTPIKVYCRRHRCESCDSYSHELWTTEMESITLDRLVTEHSKFKLESKTLTAENTKLRADLKVVKARLQALLTDLDRDYS